MFTTSFPGVTDARGPPLPVVYKTHYEHSFYSLEGNIESPTSKPYQLRHYNLQFVVATSAGGLSKPVPYFFFLDGAGARNRP